MLLGDIKRWVLWPAGGFELQLSPLSTVQRQAIRGACRVEVPPGPDAPEGTPPRVEFDVVRYQQQVGAHCVHGWRDLTDSPTPHTPRDATTLQPLPFSAAVRDLLLTVPDAADWIIVQVEGLSLHHQQEITEAGKD